MFYFEFFFRVFSVFIEFCNISSGSDFINPFGNIFSV